MSQENVELVRCFYDAVNARLEASEELFHPDYEVDLTDTAPDLGVVRGVDAFREAVLPYWQTP